jgi:hypothetical protein
MMEAQGKDKDIYTDRQGWIKLHRKIQDSPLYKRLSSKHRDVMIQVLLMANHAPAKWIWQGKEFECNPGQFITSLDSIKQKCAPDVKMQSIRTALVLLEKHEFLTNKSTKTGRLITVLNWHTYQSKEIDANKDANKDLTKSQQRPNKDLTPNNNDNNDEALKNKKEEERLSVLRDFYTKELEALDKKFDEDSRFRIPGVITESASRKGYYKFAEYIGGKNPLNKALTKCNNLEPVTGEQFEELRKEAARTGKDLYKTIISFEDNVHPSKYKSLYATILNYLNPKTEGPKAQTNLPNNGAFGPGRFQQ